MSTTQIFSHAQFDRLVQDTVQQIHQLSKLKGGEYAGDQDRLSNFRRNGAQMGIPMEVCWAIYYNKHHDAVVQYTRDLLEGKTRPRLESLAGRLDDMIVYCILFKAMLLERGEGKVEHPDVAE